MNNRVPVDTVPKVIAVGDVIALSGGAGEFGRRKAQPRGGEPFVQKWRRDLPPWMNRLIDAATQYAVVRFERAPKPEPPSELDDYLVEKVGANAWFVKPSQRDSKHAPGTQFCDCRKATRKKSRVRGVCSSCKRRKKPQTPPPYLVQDKGDKWTCSCPGYAKKRLRSCVHIRRVWRKERVGGDYTTARRREPTQYCYREGAICDGTRMLHAREELPDRVPQLVVRLCNLLVPDRSRDAERGATGMQDRVIVLALCVRSLTGKAYPIVRSILEKCKEQLQRLGHFKSVPCENTFTTRTGKEIFAHHLKAMMIEAVGVFRHLDSMVVGDSFDTPTIMVRNSRDEKAKVKPAPYRNDGPMVRTHFSAGVISQAFYMIQVSLNRGHGAADNAHFPFLMRPTKAINPGVDRAAWDKGYSSTRNFQVSEELGIDLYCREKANEDRVKNQAWGPMAARLTRLERKEDPAYEEEVRFRSLGEAPQSQEKRIKSQIRSRRRSTDPVIDLEALFGDLDDAKLSQVVEEKLAELLDAVERNVGWARLAEVFADALVHTLICIVRWEWRLEQRAEFGVEWTFPPIITIREFEVPDEAAAQALLRKIELEYGKRSFDFGTGANRSFRFGPEAGPNNEFGRELDPNSEGS